MRARKVFNPLFTLGTTNLISTKSGHEAPQLFVQPLPWSRHTALYRPASVAPLTKVVLCSQLCCFPAYLPAKLPAPSFMKEKINKCRFKLVPTRYWSKNSKPGIVLVTDAVVLAAFGAAALVHPFK